jgi:CIC family chloride channel protein
LAAGIAGGLFRLCLRYATYWRDDVLHAARAHGGLLWLAPVVLAALFAGLARLLVRNVPEVAGSGVQRIEASVRGQIPPPPLKVLPAKFVGGLLALGSGLALGREGPTVQMAASIGAAIGRRFRMSAHDTETLTIATAGAGLGVAFNAPLGGAAFSFEEVAHAFRMRLVITTLLASSFAVGVSWLIVGRKPIFEVDRQTTPSIAQLLFYAVLGILLGLLAIVYNRLIGWLLQFNDKLRKVPVEIKAAIVGGSIGLIGVLAPSLIGEGGPLTVRLITTSIPMLSLLGIFLVRFFIGPWSYSVSTPGGLFAPLLVVGAALGAFLVSIANWLVPSLALPSSAFAIVGMAAFFAGVVRAPLTGILLIVEMTGAAPLLLPLVVASVAATIVPTLLRAEPIYDSLRERLAPGTS